MSLCQMGVPNQWHVSGGMATVVIKGRWTL
jgi:hypothetical protein